MKNALILHGTSADSSYNWFSWLKEELEKKSWKVWVPNLPESNKPNTKMYNKFIFDSNWIFDEESVLIGHSSGSVAILGLLQKLPENTIVDKCILVGSFKNNLNWESLNGLFEEPFDFDKIKSKSKQFIFIHSDNDPYCPLEHAQFLSKKLGGQLIVKQGEGHFNTEKGEKYRTFPLVLKLATE